MSEKSCLTLPSGTVWEFECDYDPTDFFRALSLFTDDAVLCIESTSIDDTLLETLSKYASTRNCSITRGTVWPKSKQLHLALNTDLVNKLVEVSESHAVPEYADHVVLYGDEVILEAYDFTESPFHMSSTLPDTVVEEFAKLSKNKYRSATI